MECFGAHSSLDGLEILWFNHLYTSHWWYMHGDYKVGGSGQD